MEFGKKKRKPEPVNKKLYSLVLKKVKAKAKVWPSAYASGRVVREYKKRGGTYSFGSGSRRSNSSSSSSNSSNSSIRRSNSSSRRSNSSIRRRKKRSNSSIRRRSRSINCNGILHFGKRIITGLSRWFKEKWVNVCVKNKKNGKYASCAKSTRKYPYCRPSIRVTPDTPKTVKEISSKELKKMCKIKKNKKKMKII